MDELGGWLFWLAFLTMAATGAGGVAFGVFVYTALIVVSGMLRTSWGRQIARGGVNHG